MGGLPQESNTVQNEKKKKSIESDCLILPQKFIRWNFAGRNTFLLIIYIHD